MKQKAEKAKEITEDELKSLEKDIQKVTDDAIKTIDKMTADKEKNCWKFNQHVFRLKIDHYGLSNFQWCINKESNGRGVRHTPPFFNQKKKIMNDLLAQYVVGLVTATKMISFILSKRRSYLCALQGRRRT